MKNQLQCPITLTTMVDPVLAPDGHSYERTAIEQWIEEHGISPTGHAMTKDDLTPNQTLRDLIVEMSAMKMNDEVGQGKEDGEAVPATVVTAEVIDNSNDNVMATIRPSTYKDDESILRIQTPDYDGSHSLSKSHICCVIDISGSMSVKATSKDENGAQNETNLTVLDVVKFATLVISKTLSPDDKLSIVTYSSSTTVALPPTNMTEEGKKAVEAKLNSITAGGSTNLWAGIKRGIELSHDVGNDCVNSIFVLTDGLPNVDPPLGYERSMKKVLKNNPFLGSLSTFGFGYSLDSPLLSSIARIGGGYFSFIPDSGFVGTCFINAIANARCVFGLKPVVRIHGLEAGTASSITTDGELHTYIDDISNDLCIQLTPLRYGVSTDIVLKRRLGGNVKVDLIYEVPGSSQEVSIPFHPIIGADVNEDTFHSVRARFVKAVSEVVQHQRFATSLTNQLEPTQEIKSSTDSKIVALVRDMTGQGAEAVSTEAYYNRWGRHYLHSLMCAHLHQYCNNFKDPGVQLYGKGKLFISLQEMLDDIFEKVPPPKPSVRAYNGYTGARNSSLPASSFSARPACKGGRMMFKKSNVSMASAYNNRNAVCVDGDTSVTVKCEDQTNAKRKICEIQKGDYVLASNGDFVKVECLVETMITNNVVGQAPFYMVQVGDLKVTGYHPIRVNSDDSAWQFPVDIPNGQSFTIDCDEYSVFNLVLEEGKRHCAILMNDYECITLGHGITDDAVLNHAYFGTERIVSDLKVMKEEWASGHIRLKEGDIYRYETSREIYSIVQSSQSVKVN